MLFVRSYGIIYCCIEGTNVADIRVPPPGLLETCAKYDGRRTGRSPITMIPINRATATVLEVGNVAQLNQKRFDGRRLRTEAIAYEANNAEVPNGTELPLTPKNRY